LYTVTKFQKLNNLLQFFSFLKLNIFTLRLFLLGNFNLLNNEKSKLIYAHCMNKTFTFSNNSNNDKLITLKYFSKILNVPVLKKKTYLNSDFLIYDEASSARNKRESFLKLHIKEKFTSEFISYCDLLFFSSKFQKLIFICVLIPFVFSYFILSINKKNKGSYAILYEYIIVLNNLIFLISKYSFKKLFYFSVHRPESNLVSYLLANQSIKIFKILSDTPISFWNKNIIADTIILCNFYQFEEINNLKENIIVNQILLWGPENSPKLIFNPNLSNKLNSIGFYSTASWLREKKNKISLVREYYKDEEQCLKQILKYIEINNLKITLQILLHPIEKKEDKSIILSYYRKLLGHNSDFSIDFDETPSFNKFDKIGLGISMHSSVLHERLYCGYKSIFYSKMHQFPLRNTLIEKITAVSEAQLFRLIDKNFKISDHDFFVSNKIENYLHSKFN
tara:strand:- start:584 stop:1933 length:1350 start_codon:yes stop_codon:yes gene_type:complete